MQVEDLRRQQGKPVALGPPSRKQPEPALLLRARLITLRSCPTSALTASWITRSVYFLTPLAGCSRSYAWTGRTWQMRSLTCSSSALSAWKRRKPATSRWALRTWAGSESVSWTVLPSILRDKRMSGPWRAFRSWAQAELGVDGTGAEVAQLGNIEDDLRAPLFEGRQGV